MTTSGDVIYGGVSGTGTRLAKGSDGQVLTLASGLPSWATPTTGTVTSVATNAGLTGGTITSSGTIGLASVADKRILANISGGSAAPSANTLTGILDSAIASTQGDIIYRNSAGWVALAPGTSGQLLQSGGAAADVSWATAGGSGTVTSVAFSVPAASIFGATGTPVTTTGTLGLTTTGTSGGIPYFSSSSVISSSAALTANALVLGGGAGTTPAALGSLGSTTTVLHGNASGAPTFGAVSLTADVSGTLPIANGGTNSTATATAGGIGYGTGTAHAYTAADTSGRAVVSGGAGAPTFFAPTAGSVLFAGTSGILQQDNASLFFDDTNNRLFIGTASPTAAAKLVVNGDAINNTASSLSGTTIDFAVSNLAYTTNTCGSFTLSNIKDGGAYSLWVNNTTTNTCSFTASGFTVKMPAGHGATTTGKTTLYSFVAMGTTLMVTWNPGY